MTQATTTSTQYTGRCDCSFCPVVLTVESPLQQLTPRACDCDFCTAGNAAYLSHPQGCLALPPAEHMQRASQGSGQAAFWRCRQCKQIVAVTCEISGILKGTVNAHLLDAHHTLKPAVSVSPRLLSPDEKLARWNQVWMPVIHREGEHA